MTIFLGPDADIDALAPVHQAVFSDHAPGITMVTVAKLSNPEWQVEIEGIATA